MSPPTAVPTADRQACPGTDQGAGTWSPVELVALTSTTLKPAAALELTRSYESLGAAVDAGALTVTMSRAQAHDALGEGDVLAIGSPAYPAHLRDAPNPPPFLFTRGNVALLAGAGLGMTGTRKPSVLGTTVAELIASTAAHTGAALIQGGAVGCDTFACQAALQYEAPVIMVPATGPDQHPLGARVAAAGGLIVSEHSFGVGPDSDQVAPYRARLMARNRIIAGLSAVLIPASGTLRSGSANACWATLAAGRPLLVAQPRPSARSLPDAELPLALAHEPGATVGQLRAVGCPKQVAERFGGAGRIAHAVAGDAEELTTMTALALGLSPWRSTTPATDA